MLPLLAKAAVSDTSDSIPFITIGCGIFAVTAFLAFLLIRKARLRNHRFADQLTAAAIVWAVITAGTFIYFAHTLFEFAAEHDRMAMSGFLDIAVRTPPPRWPWPLWVAIAAVYGALFFVAARGKTAEPPAE